MVGWKRAAALPAVGSLQAQTKVVIHTLVLLNIPLIYVVIGCKKAESSVAIRAEQNVRPALARDADQDFFEKIWKLKRCGTRQKPRSWARGRSKVMARAVNSHSEQRTDWDEALRSFRGQLSFYLDYLISCNCDEEIVAAVEVEVRERFVPEEFKLRFMMRTLVRKVIEHLRECGLPTQGSQDYDLAVPDGMANIPVQERLVYFMRDILECSTRDTSLLIGITDAQVKRLLSFARRRIDMKEGPSSMQIHAPDSTYFMWKFENLHVN